MTVKRFMVSGLRHGTKGLHADNRQGQYHYDGALKELVCDLGGHGEGFILKDNVGKHF